MDKNEAKKWYLKQQLNDPNTSEWEKEHIRQRLGVELVYSENDFLNKSGSALFSLVYNFLNTQMSAIRRKKKAADPFSYFSPSLKTIYYLSTYDANFEDDCLEQLYESGALNDMQALAQAFNVIGRFAEVALIEPILTKKSLKPKEIEQLQAHFINNDNITDEIERDIEQFIKQHVSELVGLQTI